MKHISIALFGTFAKWGKATTSFVISVCPTVIPHVKTRLPWADFHEI
jgi:hypothetical protein